MAEILTEWKKVKLGTVCSTMSGGTPSRKNKDYYSGDIPWIKSGELNDGYIFGSEEKISEEGLKNSSVKLLKPGTLLIAMYGATAGKTAILKVPATTNQAVCAILENEAIDIEFIRYAFLLGRPFLLNLRHGGAQPNLNQTNISNFEISLPPLLEQKSIAQKLTSIQEAITGQEELINKLKELKRSMLQYLFTHGTKGEKTKMTEVGEIPESWEVVELGDVCGKPQYGFTDSASRKGNAKFLRITDLTEDGVGWGSVPFCNCSDKQRYLLKDGDIVFARIGATTGKSFLLKNPDNAVYASYLIRVRAEKVRSDYLYYFFQTDKYWSQINSQKGASLKGGVNGSILSKLLVPKCSDKEQAVIAETFVNIDQKINIAKEKLSAYQSLFKTLLEELMGGERKTK